MEKLEKKFEDPQKISTEDELQPMWKDMESRVTRRRSVTLDEAKGKVGRKNVKRTDEEAWLQAGLYDADGDDSSEEKKE